MITIKFNTQTNQLEVNGEWIDSFSVDERFKEREIFVFSSLNYFFMVDKKRQFLGINSGENVNYQDYQKNQWEVYKPISQEKSIWTFDLLREPFLWEKMYLIIYYNLSTKEASLDESDWVKGNSVGNQEITNYSFVLRKEEKIYHVNVVNHYGNEYFCYAFSMKKGDEKLNIIWRGVEELKEGQKIIQITCQEQKSSKEDQSENNESKKIIKEWSHNYLAEYSKLVEKEVNEIVCKICQKDIAKEERYINCKNNLKKLENFTGESGNYLTADYCWDCRNIIVRRAMEKTLFLERLDKKETIDNYEQFEQIAEKEASELKLNNKNNTTNKNKEKKLILKTELVKDYKQIIKEIGELAEENHDELKSLYDAIEKYPTLKRFIGHFVMQFKVEVWNKEDEGVRELKKIYENLKKGLKLNKFKSELYCLNCKEYLVLSEGSKDKYEEIEFSIKFGESDESKQLENKIVSGKNATLPQFYSCKNHKIIVLEEFESKSDDNV